jgi:hypothetical protein
MINPTHMIGPLDAKSGPIERVLFVPDLHLYIFSSGLNGYSLHD